MNLLLRSKRGKPTAGDLPANLIQPSPARGIFRLTLLILVAVVVLINLPFITRHFIPGHDGKVALAVFDYMYGNWLFAGELPHWMVYGFHGLNAAAFQVAFLSAASYLSFFWGKVLGVTDSLTLFSVTLCVEQLLFLLGFYLLSRRLFRERLTVFCICFTAVSLIAWQDQPFWNLRLFCLLPLAFYLILRLRHDGAGYCGWLAGIVFILGSEGASYFYIFWAFLLTVFSLAVFGGGFGSLKAMFQIRVANVVAAILFVCLALVFLGVLSHVFDNFKFGSPGRSASGKVALSTFLTYGGSNLSDMLSALLMPSANMNDTSGRSGMTDYVGLICFLCFPLALIYRRNSRLIYPFLITLAVVAALSLGGIFATLIFFLPGMNMFRHVGFLPPVIKVLVLIVAGFGFDALINLLREQKFIPRPTWGKLLLIGVALLFYVDLNIGGQNWARVCQAIQMRKENLFDVLEEATIYTFTRTGLMLAFVLSAWQLCRSSISPVTEKRRDFVFTLLVVCVIGDGVLFQSELYSHLHRRPEPFAFPAAKLSWPIPRDAIIPTNAPANRSVWISAPGTKLHCDIAPYERITTNTLLKYQAWTNAPGGKDEISLSCVFQWDSPAPKFRADWLAENVVAMEKILQKVSPRDLAVVSGSDGLKFRLLGDSSAIHVKSDTEALKLLGSRAGWDRQVILTDPEGANTTNVAPTANSDSSLNLGKFSANSFFLSLSNGMAQPAWLIYADAYSPDWHATVNQKPVPILQAYGAFKAIQVPPGSSQVRFYYSGGIHCFCMDVFAVMSGSAVAVALLWLLWLITKELCGW